MSDGIRRLNLPELNETHVVIGPNIVQGNSFYVPIKCLIFMIEITISFTFVCLNTVHLCLIIK